MGSFRLHVGQVVGVTTSCITDAADGINRMALKAPANQRCDIGVRETRDGLASSLTSRLNHSYSLKSFEWR